MLKVSNRGSWSVFFHNRIALDSQYTYSRKFHPAGLQRQANYPNKNFPSSLVSST